MESIVLVLNKVVDVVFVVDDKVRRVETLMLVLIKVVVGEGELSTVLVPGVLINTGELGANVELMEVPVLKVVEFGFVEDEKLVTELVETLMLVLIKVVDLVVVGEEEVSTVLGVLNKTGELVGANVEVMRMMFSVLNSAEVVVRVDVLVLGKVVSRLGPNVIVVASFVSVGTIVLIGQE